MIVYDLMERTCNRIQMTYFHSLNYSSSIQVETCSGDSYLGVSQMHMYDIILDKLICKIHKCKCFLFSFLFFF